MHSKAKTLSSFVGFAFKIRYYICLFHHQHSGGSYMGGFIPGSRGSFMLDLVAIAMLAILPTLVFAINSVKKHLNYSLHKKIMLTVAIILGVAVVLFELEMRLVGWRQLAEPSPYFNTVLPWVLAIHLTFSISTTVLLFSTVWLALKNFPSPPTPGQHSSKHKLLGKLTAVGLFLTSCTGWTFYYLAFIAK